MTTQLGDITITKQNNDVIASIEVSIIDGETTIDTKTISARMHKDNKDIKDNLMQILKAKILKEKTEVENTKTIETSLVDLKTNLETELSK